MRPACARVCGRARAPRVTRAGRTRASGVVSGPRAGRPFVSPERPNPRRTRGDHAFARARGVAAGADAEINLFRRGSRASRFFRAAGPHSRKNLDVARARRARAFEFERSVVSVGAVVSVKGRARARRASAVVARVEGCARATDGDARARPSTTTTTTTTTTTDAVVARRRRRRRARRRSSSAVAPRPPETSHAVDGTVFNLHFTRQRGHGLFLFRMSIHIHMSNVFKCPYVYYLRLSHDSSESS